MTPPPSSSTVADTNRAGYTQGQPEAPNVSVASTPFVWGVGIECSFIPHIDVDQFEWTQHDRFWREDLRMIREQLGVTHLRYALPWHKIETEPGKFDWTMADERMAYCRELGLELMMDVMHFGCPKWLPLAVGDPRFPESLERFATAMAERYGHQIKTWCPFNEPLVSALFSGDFGFWPPFHRKWRGYMPVLSRIVQAVNRANGAIRKVQPDATILLCDAFENFQTKNPSLKDEVSLRNLRRFIILDLLAGRVDHHHPLYTWLTSFGFSELDLEFFKKNPQMPDVIGLDYYPHSDWQIEMQAGLMRQRRADAPLGVYALAKATYDRYGLPLMVTETSVDGPPISREVWLGNMVSQIRQLREEGIPMTGLIWWPAFDQIDWDGALTHRIGKIHKVGVFSLQKQSDGTYKRLPTPLVDFLKDLSTGGNAEVGELGELAVPVDQDDPQLPPLYTEATQWNQTGTTAAVAPAPAAPAAKSNGNGHSNGNGNGHAATVAKRISEVEPAAGVAGEPAIAAQIEASDDSSSITTKSTDRYGIVVFSHLRWGFVWQRPQQFLSRFARSNPILFVEEPFFDLRPGSEVRLDLHNVMPNVTVACAHCPPEWATNPQLPDMLRQWVREAMASVNSRGEFDAPLLWYYSPMDSAWSLGHFTNRGVVYDCMDELSQFTGAPKELIDNEKRLIDHSDVVFTGGYELWTKKQQLHPNCHFHGCGVEFEHFNKAQDPNTTIPHDIDFMPRPIIGWFGVVDERVNYPLLAEVARLRPDWSLAIVGPVVKVDPNLLPYAPNLHFLGGRDYQQLPNYCKAFDVCMMCFALNKATEFINPTKALEYLATGKPVLSTAVKDVVRQYSDVVEIASGPEDFVAKAAKLLHDPNPNRVAAGLELARQNGWDNTVKTMRDTIREAIQKDPSERRSTQAKPGSDPSPQYFYRHTQGS